MGSSETEKSAKEVEDTPNESKTANSQEQTSATAKGTVNPDWTGFQPYPMPPHGFLASSPQVHPYMWGVQSEENDDHIQTNALREYQSDRGPFPYMKCWSILHGSDKWRSQPDLTKRTTRRAKKSKMSSSAGTESLGSNGRTFNINLNDTDDEDDHEVETTELPGRDRSKGKRAVSSPSRQSYKTSTKERDDEVTKHLKELVLLRKEHVRVLNRRQMQKDLKQLQQPLPEDELARALALKLRERIKNDYGL